MFGALTCGLFALHSISMADQLFTSGSRANELHISLKPSTVRTSAGLAGCARLCRQLVDFTNDLLKLHTAQSLPAPFSAVLILSGSRMHCQLGKCFLDESKKRKRPTCLTSDTRAGDTLPTFEHQHVISTDCSVRLELICGADVSVAPCSSKQQATKRTAAATGQRGHDGRQRTIRSER